MAKPIPLLLWGSKLLGRSVWELVASPQIELVAVFDTDVSAESPFPGVPLHHGREGYLEWEKRERDRYSDLHFAVAIGRWGEGRWQTWQFLKSRGHAPLDVIHSSAWISPSATREPGVLIFPRAVVGLDVSIGSGSLINLGAIINPQTRIGRGCHIAPGANVAGLVTIEDCAFVGIGATILPRLRIGRGAVISAGAVVTKDVPPYTDVKGIPARAKRAAETERRL